MSPSTQLLKQLKRYRRRLSIATWLMIPYSLMAALPCLIDHMENARPWSLEYYFSTIYISAQIGCLLSGVIIQIVENYTKE